MIPLCCPVLVSQDQGSLKPEAKLVRPNVLQASREQQWSVQPLTKLSILGAESDCFIMIRKKKILDTVFKNGFWLKLKKLISNLSSANES